MYFFVIWVTLDLSYTTYMNKGLNGEADCTIVCEKSLTMTSYSSAFTCSHCMDWLLASNYQ